MLILNRPFCRISISLVNIAKYSVHVSNTTDAFVFKSSLSREEQDRVLDVLNSSDSEQLASFRISQRKIKSLETWRTKKGPFRSLSDVLEVEGLGEKLLTQICDKIICNEVEDNTSTRRNTATNRRLKQLVSPALNPFTLDNLMSTIGIHLGPMGASWAKFTRGLNEISDWQCQDFSKLPKKMLPSETFTLATEIISKLPPGDVYILEGIPAMSPQGPTQASALTTYNQQLELTSMLIALLNTSVYHNQYLKKKEDSDRNSIENVVYQLRSKLPARLFKTLVGTERVSTLATVLEMVESNDKSKPFTLPCTPIVLDKHLQSAFFSQSATNKELLGQALLLVVTFMDLCVYKNPVSLISITPNQGRKNGN